MHLLQGLTEDVVEDSIAEDNITEVATLTLPWHGLQAFAQNTPITACVEPTSNECKALAAAQDITMVAYVEPTSNEC